MIVKRTQELNTDTFSEGDIITLNCNNGKTYTATAIESENGKTLFILDQILDECVRIDPKNNTEIIWENSELHEKANLEILGIFPDEIKALIFSYKDYGYLFPPSREMLFNYCNNPDYQFSYFKNPENIIAKRKDRPGCYWLINPRKTACFYYVDENGKEDITFANCQAIGFRPMFCLRDPKSLKNDIPETIESLEQFEIEPDIEKTSSDSFSEAITFNTGLPDIEPDIDSNKETVNTTQEYRNSNDSYMCEFLGNSYNSYMENITELDNLRNELEGKLAELKTKAI